jgi:hypothetical protein
LQAGPGPDSASVQRALDAAASAVLRQAEAARGA